MAEPTYIYKKGEGWVISRTHLLTQGHRSFETIDIDGCRVLIIDRPPKLGEERGVAYFPHEKDIWFNDEGLIFDTVVNHISKYCIQGFSKVHALGLNEMQCTLIQL